MKGQKIFLYGLMVILVLTIALSGCGGGGGNDSPGGGGTTTYSVTYLGNGSDAGSVPVDSTSYQAGQEVTVLGNTGNLVKEGYSFTGWSTNTQGTGVNYNEDAKLTMPAHNVTLYARWLSESATIYTVTYHANYTGGPSSETEEYEAGTVVTVRGQGDLNYAGHTFEGWNTEPGGGGTNYTGSFTISGNVVLYAQWEEESTTTTYNVTYNANTGSGSVPDSATYAPGANITILGNTGNLTKSNYVFAGWNTAADGNGINYQPGATFQMGTEAVTLFARWTFYKKFDFQTYTGGVYPPGYNTPSGIFTNIYSQGTVTHTRAAGPDQDPSNECMKVEASVANANINSWRMYSNLSNLANTTGIWELSGEIYISDMYMNQDLFLLVNPSNTMFTTLSFRTDGTIKYGSGDGLGSITGPYLTEKWYKVRVRLNLNEGFYSSWVTNLTDGGTETVVADARSIKSTGGWTFSYINSRVFMPAKVLISGEEGSVENPPVYATSVTYIDNLEFKEVLE